MQPSPDDVVWSPEDALRALRSAFPELELAHVTPLGRGWDADVFASDDGLCFRFARNLAASLGMEREQAVMARLAPSLPHAVPVPLHAARAGEQRFMVLVTRLIPGRTVCDARLSRVARAGLAAALASFVRALHACRDGEILARLGADPFARFDAAARTPLTVTRLASFAERGLLAASVAAKLVRIVEAGPGEASDACIVHTDLHVRNLLVHEGELAGVIDWIDLHHGERASDLASAFEVLPAEGRAEFFARYGDVPRAVRERARWRALVHGVATLSGSEERGDVGFAESTRTMLSELVEDEV